MLADLRAMLNYSSMSAIFDAIHFIPTSYVIFGLLGLIGLGFCISLARLQRIDRRRETVLAWRQNFIDWANGGFGNRQSYMNLMSSSPRVQEALGRWGIMGTFCPPFGQVIYHNWPVVLNGLPTIRQYADDDVLSRNQTGQYVQLVDDALLKGIGALDDELQHARWALLNPVALLREGIVRIITVPVYILAEFGLLSKRAYDWTIASVFVRAIAFLIGATGFISAVVGLVTGWGQFYSTAREFLASYGL